MADPARIGPYDLLELLGSGANGEVHRARHRLLGRDCALKVLRDVGTAARRRDVEERFLREARALAKLEHAGIVRVHDVGVADGKTFLAMELVGPRTLDALIKERGRLAPALALAIVEKLARALAFAHARGVVHRDIKPSNIVLGADDEPKLIDFGLAKDTFVSSGGLTRDGMVVGTPAYAAPEQARGEGASATGATDVWALGVVLYELLSGKLPFEGQNLVELLGQIEVANPPLPRGLDGTPTGRAGEIALLALAKAPDARPTAHALADECARARSSRRAPSALAAVAVVAGALALVALGALVASRRPRPSPPPVVSAIPSSPTTPAPPVRRSLSAALATTFGMASGFDALDVASLGTFVAVAGPTHPLRFIDATGAEVAPPFPTGSEAVRVVAIPARRELLTASPDGRLRLWDAAGRMVAETRTRHAEIRGLAVDPTGAYAACAGHSELELWSVAALTSLSLSVRGVVDNPHGPTFIAGRLLVAGGDNLVRDWHVPQGERASRGVVFPGVRALALAASADGRSVACASGDGKGQLWDMSGEKPRCATEISGVGLPRASVRATIVTLSPDARHVAFGRSDGRVLIWDLGDASLRTCEARHAGAVTGLAFSSDGRTLWSTGGDGSVRVSDALGRALVPPPLGSVVAVAASPDGKRVLAFAGQAVVVWDMGSRKRALWHEASGEVLSAAWANESLIVACGPMIALRGGPDGVATVSTFTARGVTAVACRAGTVFAGTDAGGVGTWDLATPDPPSAPEPRHAKAVRSIAVSSDGARVLSAAEDGAQLFEIGEKKLLGSLASPVRAATLSADGSTALLLLENGALILWTPLARDGKGSTELSPEDRTTKAAALSSNGSLVLVAHDDGRVVVLSVPSGEEVAAALVRGSPTSVAFLPGDAGFVVGAAEGTVHRFDLVSR